MYRFTMKGIISLAKHKKTLLTTIFEPIYHLISSSSNYNNIIIIKNSKIGIFVLTKL